ncbi:MAG TPA: Rieske 2Fe-2S domain-containing protein [Bacteroidota bacterium]|nr:Rieske 2Fe-2S domain-containing protein [Bacteroidota bacterium]
MDRKEFLAALGIGAASLAGLSLFPACQVSDPVSSAPTNVDFTLDLTDPANSALKSNGGYIYKNSIIVARTTSSSYVAVYSACTHAGATVMFDGSANRFHCPAHGSNFSTTGSVINGPATQALHQYNTSLTGTSLRVYS